jgi:OmpA-OmpF porin, OOP family
MKLNHRMLVSAAAVLGLAVPFTAGAQVYATATPKESGFYVGGLLGYSSIDVKKSDWDAIVGQAYSAYEGTITSSSLSKGDFGWGLNLGYQVMRNFAVEVGYLDLGKTKGTTDGTLVIDGASVPASLRGDFKSSGFEAALIGIWPFDNGWAIDGRVGLYAGDTKFEATATAGGQTASAHESASKSTFLGGVGFSYSFYNNYQARFDYMYIDKVGDTGKIGGTAPVDLFSVGFRYTF